MAVAGIIFVLVVISCSGIQAGPGHGHAHTHDHKIKEWQITVAVKSGLEDPSWNITENARKSPLINRIARYLDAYSHHPVAVGKKLLSISGYKGFTIRHVADGNRTITVQLPKCLIPELEKLLIKYTIPKTANVSETLKKAIICTVENCKRKKVNCYPTPTTTPPNPTL